MSQKWLEKFGGYENENEGTNYQSRISKYRPNAAIISKKKTVMTGGKAHNSVPFLGAYGFRGGAKSKESENAWM